ncbi:MAG: hypothetical protein M3N91_06815 [Pseudomonadota bacterium]|nr:hypothetical protein [Pseudomonadota bacterium]
MASHTARSDWVVATAAVLSQDDNVGNARSYGDQVSDFNASGTASAVQLIPIGDGYSLVAGGDLAGQLYDSLTGLRNASLDGLLSLKKKWGLGAFATWARAGISVGRSDYEDGYRDATIYRASLELGKRVDERWNLAVKYAFERRAATPGRTEILPLSSDAFSQEGRNFTVNVQYSLSDRLALSLGTLSRHGDVVSTTRAAGYYYRLADLKAAAPDPTFGRGAYAYRLEGTTYGARLGADYSLTNHSLIGCGFQRLETHARGGNNYTNSVPQLTWSYQF